SASSECPKASDSRFPQYSNRATPALGQSATMMLAPSSRSLSSCQSSSVINGMNGCSALRTLSKNAVAWACVAASMGLPYSGLIISRYHEQKSSQISLYNVINASDTLNLAK